MSSRGAAGATKPKLHNVNSIYAGKNHNAVKAPGLGKHGLQSLGKTTAVVRRMPPPATLPSLRAESQGQDPNVALVPQGGTGWNKNTTAETTNSSDSTSTLKPGIVISGNATGVIGSHTGGQHTTDLRPTWAKPANSQDLNATTTQNSPAVTASARDFPSLAAATASTGKQSSALLNDSLKPQKSGTWRAGGGSAQSKNEGEEVVPSSQPRSLGSNVYSTTTAVPRNTERQLPSRYYDGSDTYSPPTGAYQIPKQVQNIAPSATPQLNAEHRPLLQEENPVCIQPAVVPQQPVPTRVVFPANVAIPPPNYSQPPPNFQPVQAQTTQRIYTPPQAVTHPVAESGNLRVEEVQEAVQKNGRGEGGYREEGAKVLPLKSTNSQAAAYVSQNEDFDKAPRERNEKAEKTEWRKDVRGHSITGILQRYRQQPGERHPAPMGDVDWPSSQYGYVDREAEIRRWRNAGGGGHDSSSAATETTQYSYGREHEEDFGRRENVEREAAIERSRRKRRTANQNSLPSESESSNPPMYGNIRSSKNFDNEMYSEWDRSPQGNYAQGANDGGGYSADKPAKSQSWGARYEGKEFDEERREVKKNEETDPTSKLPEYKVLRRPDSRDSSELSQQVSQISIQQDEPEDEDDELQLTKLSHPATKVVKRVAPCTVASQEPEPTKPVPGQTALVPAVTQSVPTSATQRPQYSQPRMSFDKRKVESNGKRQESLSEAAAQKAGERERKPRATKDIRPREEPPVSNVKQTASPTIVAAPLPPDNVWEKRAEEREVAQRAAKKDFVDSDHFPAFNEEPKPEDFSDQFSDVGQGSYLRKDAVRSDASMHKQRANRHRNQNWSDNSYSVGYGQFDSNDYYGQDDEEDSGKLFRGQREFVNSRVSAHHRSRGGSLIGVRDSKGRGASSGGLRRGISLPRQTAAVRGRRMQMHFGGERSDKYGQRRNRRQEEQIPEQEDKFANMGEFRVEDTYPALSSTEEKQPLDDVSKEDTPESTKKVAGERRGGRSQRTFGQRTQQQYRSTQQYYQPRTQNEEYGGRFNGRGTNRARGSVRRGELYTAGGSQIFSERGKRKKDYSSKREETHDGLGEEEGKTAAVTRDEGSVKEHKKSLPQQTRYRRSSPTREDTSSATQQPCVGADRVAHMKSPVTSEGQEEWETASESSDVGDRQKTQRRTGLPTKFSSTRRVKRTTNAPRRENTGEAAATTTRSTHSKNVKPASTTLHAAVRGVQSHSQEAGQVTSSEPHKREGACRDGLAGLDINDAGVVVIDDLRDTENVSENAAEDGDDDFEEVISKKSKRIRQQQINEQLEAERRKQKEKEKEKRKAKPQAKKTEKKPVVPAKEVKVTANVNGAGVGRVATESQNSTSIGTSVTTKSPPAMLNTTVWNSSIIKEQGLPPLDNHPVIPSPIARPVHKTGITTSTSSSTPTTQKTVEAWTRPDEEQRQTTSKKLDDSPASPTVKKTTVEFAASFNSPPTRPESSQYDFTFDPSLQDDSRPLSPKSPTKAVGVSGEHLEGASLKSLTVEQNDDERLKERLDKVKDFWPGQQFTNSLLDTAVGATTISQLNDKSSASNAAATSLHGPNVAKVRPQPQTNDSCGPSMPLKDSVSASAAASVLPPPSPVACIPPGTYLQSLAQVPPPAALPHYSMVFGEPFSLHSATSPPAQAIFNGGVSATQGPTSRSRPTSFIEQSQLFIHPPPSGNASSNLTWSNPNPQLEILPGITPTPTLPSQSRPTSVQRFQFPSQAPSGSTYGTPPPVLNGTAKLSHIAPPPHPHQVPPPLHPPHNFMPPLPPHDFFPHQNSALGPVGSQRATDVSSQGANSGGLARSGVGILGQVPPPHVQHMNFQPQSPSAFGLPGTSAFNQVPPMHAFTAPPPPLRYPPVQTVSSDVNGVATAGWGKSAVTSFSMKFANGGCAPNVVSLDRNGGRNSVERWAMPTSMPQQFQNNFVYQPQSFGKDNNEGMTSSAERYSAQCTGELRRETVEERASTASSISANGPEAVENSKKATTKV